MADPYPKLVEALVARSGGTAVVRRGHSRRWASVTFEGNVNFVTLALPADAADRFVTGLAEAEFAIPGHLVADIAVAGRQEQGDAVVLEIEALVLEEA